MLVQNLQGNDQGDMIRRARRSLLLIGGAGFIPDCNIVAVMHEFPHMEIHYAEDLREALADYDPPLAALLIEEASLGNLGDFEHDLLEAHRDRVVALVVEGAHHASPITDILVARGLVRSVLPMNLRLETWLLALRLLLRGGEFAPISLARSRLHSNAQPEAAPAASVPPDRGRATMSGLTERELQVLQMVSTGCPNRVIADRFGLSEHTVKVHVHNIIRKLKARNRTEAAAIYLEAAAKPIDDAGATILTTLNGQQA